MEKGAGPIVETERLLSWEGIGSSPSSASSPKKPTSISHLFTSSSGLSVALDNLSRTHKFCLLVLGLFFFFGLHNFLQEKIMRFPDFTYGWVLGWLEVLGVTVFSNWERRWNGEAGIRRAPLQSYVYTTLCLLGSSSLSNIALNYINYPTKVVFRSCKLIPTMALSSFMNKRRFTPIEYLAAVAICVGLILFAFADINVSPSFSPKGIILVTLSIICDAILPNLQERLFSSGASRLEVTYYSNIFTLMAMTLSMLFSGDLWGAAKYTFTHTHTHIGWYMCVYTLLAYLAISLHMTMVKMFGSVCAVLVGNSRKTMTIVLSFVLFPKPFSVMYVYGGVLVLGGLTVSGYIKGSEGNKKGVGGGNGGVEKGSHLPAVGGAGGEVEMKGEGGR